MEEEREGRRALPGNRRRTPPCEGGAEGGRFWATKVGCPVGEEVPQPSHRKAEEQRDSKVHPDLGVWVAGGGPTPAPSHRPADWLPPAGPRLSRPWPSRPGPASPRYSGVVGAATRGPDDGQVLCPAPSSRARPLLHGGA